MTASVSVIVPTYNRAPWIGATLRSILGQSVQPSEIIVVDDGSSDDTESVCATFGPQVRFVRQANGGVSRARNHGASLATGTWLAFVDSDDLWRPEKLRLQLAALDATDGSWCISGADTVDFDGNAVPGREGFSGIFSVFREEKLNPLEHFERFLAPREIAVAGGSLTIFTGDAYPALFLGNFALPSSSVIRRDIFLDVGGFSEDFRLAEETEFFHRLAAREPVTLLVPSLVGYRMSQPGSLVSAANIARLVENAINSGDRALRLRSDDTGSTFVLYARGRRRLLRKLAWVHLSSYDGAKARLCLRQARTAGDSPDLRYLAIYALSWLPRSVLRTLHAVMRLRG